MNSQNKISAINAYCLPAIRYTAGIVDWNLNDLRAMDRKTRKLLTINRGLHPRSDVDHLYLPRKKRLRRMKSVDVLHKEKCSLFHYLVKSKESLLKVVYGSGLIETSETKCEFMQREQSEWLAFYLQKALYGYFVRSQDKNVSELANSYWLTKGDLTFETEGLLIAAQDQVLNTRAMQQVYSGSASTRCRLCNTQAETIEQLISGCSQLADTQYKLRHDNVARYIHRCLYGKYNIE